MAIPWRRLLALARPVRKQLAAMVALSGFGSLVGLVPALALGSLVNDLAGAHDGGGAALAAGLIVAAIVLEALAFTLSDGFFAKAVSTLYRDLRVMMFNGVQRTPPREDVEVAGLASRFVSDAEAMQELIVSPLDTAVIGCFELISALVALAVLNAPGAGAAVVLGVLAASVARLTQTPAASAAHERQEALEAMGHSLAAELSRRLGHEDASRQGASRRFAQSATRVLRKEVRLGWLEAASRYGSGAAASLGPIAVVVVSALTGNLRAGTLLSVFLLAQRAFSAAEDLLEIGLDIELVRGAVARCFELVDRGGAHSRQGDERPWGDLGGGQVAADAQSPLTAST